MARGLKFRFKEVEGLYCLFSQNKGANFEVPDTVGHNQPVQLQKMARGYFGYRNETQEILSRQLKAKVVISLCKCVADLCLKIGFLSKCYFFVKGKLIELCCEKTCLQGF